MKNLVAAAALLLLAGPALAQDVASPAQHHPQAPSPSAAPSEKHSADAAPGKMDMKMDMMERCKMMREQKSRDAKPLDKSMDCAAMHHKMHNSEGAAHRR